VFTKSHSSRETTPKNLGYKKYSENHTHLEVTVTMVLIVRFMIYPDLNLVMNSVRILNNKESSLKFRLIYSMTYTV